jgi:hypothetical protein
LVFIGNNSSGFMFRLCIASFDKVDLVTNTCLIISPLDNAAAFLNFRVPFNVLSVLN